MARFGGRARACAALATIASLLLVASIPLSSLAEVSPGENSGGIRNQWQGPYSSWALGIVVPEGASLTGGGSVSWGDESNVSVIARLPNITMPDGITYVVLSVMGNDRTVYQVAAGAWPHSTSWSVYSWFIQGIDTQSPAYTWVANSTGPRMSSGDLVSMSMFIASPAWGYSIRDENTGAGGGGFFPATHSGAFESGDQEVFSFESYSHTASTFEYMGNLTLESISVDGKVVRSGWYTYSGWDPAHTPLFLVGSASAPSFISFATGPQGEPVWGYSPPWTGGSGQLGTGPIVAACVVLGVVAASWISLGKRRGRSG